MINWIEIALSLVMLVALIVHLRNAWLDSNYILKDGRFVRLPTVAEDRAIDRGIAEDPDARELTDEDIDEMRPVKDGMPHLVKRHRRDLGDE